MGIVGIQEIWQKNKEGGGRRKIVKGKIKSKDIERIKKLYDSGEVEKALKVAEAVAAKSPTDAWGVFLRLAREAEDADEKAFWTVCASFAAAVPLSFLPIGDCFASLSHLAYCIDAGFVEYEYNANREKGKKFLFKTNGDAKTISEVGTVVYTKEIY